MIEEKRIPILLYGDLRKRFGRRRDLAVKTTAEAIRALQVVVPGFDAYLRANLDTPFRVLRGEVPLDEKGLQEPVGRTECIKIVPVVKGAKDGWGQVLIGAALLAAVAISYGTLTGPALAWYASAAVNVGTALILGGVAQLLANAPQSAAAGIDQNNDFETWSFGSPTLTTGQGGCVPVLLGEHRIGGHLISAGIDAQAWQPGGFNPEVCLTDDGTRYGNGDTVPWMWAIAP